MPKMHFCENFRIPRNIVQSVLQRIIGGIDCSFDTFVCPINIHYLDAETYFSKKNLFRKKFSNVRETTGITERNLSIFPLPSSWFYRHLSFRCRDVFFKEESSSKKFSNLRNDRDHRKKSFDFSFHDSIDTSSFRCGDVFFKERSFSKKFFEIFRSE